MFFLPAPEQPKKVTTYREVDHKEAAKKTEDLLFHGIEHGVFKVERPRSVGRSPRDEAYKQPLGEPGGEVRARVGRRPWPTVR